MKKPDLQGKPPILNSPILTESGSIFHPDHKKGRCSMPSPACVPGSTV